MKVFAHVALCFWIGAVACVAFPVAFSVFGVLDDNELAGKVMAPIFRAVDLYGIAAAALFAFAAAGSRWRLATAVAIGGAAAFNAFWVAGRVDAMNAYHHVSVGLWMAILAGGTVLAFAGSGKRAARDGG